MSARLPTLRLRRAFTVRRLETMAAVQVPSTQTEWLPMLRLASERAQQSRPLTPEDISQHLLPLSVAAARTWLEQAVHCGMLTATGSPELPTYALSTLGAAAAQLGVSTEAQQGLFRFAVTDEPLLAGHHVLHLEERREASAGETIPLEEQLATEPGACGRSLLQPNTPFVVVRTADVVRMLPTPQELIIELELAPDHAGPCLLYTSPSPRDRTRSRMPSSA